MGGAYRKEYYEKNKEKCKARMRSYYFRHKEELSEYKHNLWRQKCEALGVSPPKRRKYKYRRMNGEIMNVDLPIYGKSTYVDLYNRGKVFADGWPDD